MAFRIMLFDVLKLCCLAKGRDVPVEMPHPLVERRIAGADISNIAFEMLDIHGVEANNGGVKAYVCFCDLVAKINGCSVLGEMGFGAVE